MTTIPYLDFGGKGQPLHFLHANGYPPACYRPLTERLASQYHAIGMLLRPLWPNSKPEEIRDWIPFTNDLLEFLNEQKLDSVIGVGHSIGAIVTLRAALKEPKRFRALVLMDPVLFPPCFILEWNLARTFGLGNKIHPLIRGALKRRREFDDLDKVFDAYRRRAVFRFFSDDSLGIFIDGMTKPTPDGHYELAFSPEWEARIYYTGIWRDLDLWKNLPRLDVPTIILRGAETDTFWESTAKSVEKRNPNIKIVTLEKSTHLLPLERPQQVFDIMQDFLKSTQVTQAAGLV
jgi:pimeloyl-ACP methyl ester carboxylesterase